MRRALAIAAVAMCAACSGGGSAKSPGTPERARTGKVARGAVVDRVLVTGRLHATSSEELRVPRTEAWELPIRWMAEDGTLVKKGDRALEFDNSAFTATLEQKKLALISAILTFNAFIDVSALDLAQKEFTLQSEQIALAKAKVLASVPADLLPARTAQDRQLELRRAEAATARAQKELASAKASNALERQVKQIEHDKARDAIDAAEKSIGELVLTAPRDGIIVVAENPWEDRKFQVGDTVQPGWTIVSLPDANAGMEVRGELSDVDDGRVSVGMKGSCTLDAFPLDPLPCSVKDLMPVASGQGGKSLRRGFALVLQLERADPERMRPGMAVKAELQRPPEQGALVVPRGAVVFTRDTKGAKARVRLASGSTRDVELGACDAQGCVVQRGLAEGEAVAIGGVP